MSGILKFVRSRTLPHVPGLPHHDNEARQKLQKELFDFKKTVHHGFPHRPTAMAHDPDLNLLAIGTRTGQVRIYGAPGVEFSGQHEGSAAVVKLVFLPNQGRLISLLDDNSLHTWEWNLSDGKSTLEIVRSCRLEASKKEEKEEPAKKEEEKKEPNKEEEKKEEKKEGDEKPVEEGATEAAAPESEKKEEPEKKAEEKKPEEAVKPEEKKPEAEAGGEKEGEKPAAAAAGGDDAAVERKVSALCLARGADSLYVGTETGDVYVIDVATLTPREHVIYADVVAQNAGDELKVNPGSVEVILEHPTDADRLVIGYRRGLVAVWNNKKSYSDHTFTFNQDLESICWVRGGEKFVCTYADGSYIIWTLEDGVKSLQTATTPYGPFPCKPITKVDYKTAPGDAFLIFAGGMPRASYGDRHTVTVMRGDKHVAFEFTSKFVDCLVLSSGDADAEHDDPHTLVVLADEEVVLIDLETDGWPTFKLPYLQSPHASAIMCTTHCSNVPEALWNNIAAAGEKQGSIHSPRDWPITGGKSLNEEVTKRELLLTGHEDGVVRFWDVSGIAMKLLYKLNTAPFFLSEHENQQDHDEEWPPFRKVGTFDPYSDDPRLGIQKISLCLANAILAVGGTAGQVVLLEMSMEEKEKELHEIYVQIIDRDNFVWKGHEPLTPKDGPLKLAAGCQPLTVMQMTPPAACTALALSSEYGLVAAGTAHGLTLFDYVQKKEVLSRCTLEAGAGEAGTPKRKNFRKSLRESFRRLRKVRLRKAPAAEDAGEEKRAKKEKKEKEKKEEKVSEVKEKKEETKEETKPEEKKEEEKKDEDKKEETKEAEPASVEPAEETETQASTETAEVTAEEAPATTTADEKKGEEVEEAKQKDEEKKEEEGEKKEEATEEATKPEEPKPESSKVEEEARPKSPEKTEAREDEGMPSVVRCLCITRTFLVNGTTNTPTLWAGTGSGAIYIYTVTIPNAEQRKEEAVSAQLGKEIQLKHKAAVMAIQVIDSANYPLPDTAAASKNIAKEPNMDGNHKVIICSMEQFKVFHLPSLKPYCKYKLVSHHSSLVRRIGFVKYTSSKNEEYSEWCLTCMSQLGELSIYSIPQLRKQILKPCTSKDDIHGIGSTVFTQDGEGMYLSSASEFVRFSLCPHMVTDATCVLELAEGMRPPPPQPKPEVTVETEEAAKVKGKVEAAEAPAAEEKKEEAKEEEGKAEPEKEGEAEEKTEEGEKPVDESTPGEMTGDITQDSITDHIADEEKATEDKAKEIESTAVEVKKIEDGGANEAPPVTAGGDQ